MRFKYLILVTACDNVLAVEWVIEDKTREEYPSMRPSCYFTSIVKIVLAGELRNQGAPIDVTLPWP